MNWLRIAQLILGEAEVIVPLFVHNPKTQQVDAVIATTLAHVLDGLTQGSATKTPAASPGASSAP